MGTALFLPMFLPIADLANRHEGLTPGLALSYEEALRVCLDRHHASPITFELWYQGNNSIAETEWQVTTHQLRAAWANETDATEAGAYCLVLAAIELCCGMRAVRRAETLTGADYYVAADGVPVEDLEDCWRLEISGSDKADRADLDRPLKKKIRQAERGRSNLPALAGVAGFLLRQVLMKKVGSDDLV